MHLATTNIYTHRASKVGYTVHMTETGSEVGQTLIQPNPANEMAVSQSAPVSSIVTKEAGPPRFQWWMLAPVIALVLLCIGVLALFSADQYPVPSELVPVSVGGVALMVGIADSNGERAQGLSGRPSLPHDEGLLFIFDTAGTYGFWMKEMNFPIDILWFDESRLLIDISSKVDPSTYPQSFAPRAPAQYVLEVNAGFVEEKKIKLGDQLSF